MNDKYDIEDLKNLNAEDWQIECLKKNPNYVYWGNFEDYMCKDSGGWDSRVNADTITEGLWSLDELNEVVNFYFEVTRESEPCEHCDQSGYNPETKKIKDSWYSFDNSEWVYIGNKRYNSQAWQYCLTEIEIEALVKAGRLTDLIKINCSFNKEENKWYGWIDGVRQEIEKPEYPTPDKVNEWAKHGFGHDAINQSICVEARAKHLGVYGYCEYCDGKGYNYITDKARLGLQLWFLHPRKGCSKGVYIKDIKQEELSKVIEYLKEAAQRNADRFSRL